MKSLFLRIFLSFWAALVLFILLSILVAIAVNPARGIESQEPEILAEAVNAYQSGGEHAVHEYLEAFWRKEHVRAFIFDPAGKELSGHQHIPPWVEDSRRNAPLHRGWWDSLMPARIKRLALTLDGKRFTLVIEMPPGPLVFLGPHASASDYDCGNFVGIGVLSARALDDEADYAAAAGGAESGGRRLDGAHGCARRPEER